MSMCKIDREQLYSCLPISNSRLYERDFVNSLRVLNRKCSLKTKTEKNINILENDMIQTPRLQTKQSALFGAKKLDRHSGLNNH